MIIGNGLLARSLQEVDKEEIVLFCSGVSDSNETDQFKFKREIDLLLSQNYSKKIFYFSTISIYNPAKIGNTYIDHKKAIEELIANKFSDFLILRLPNMIGLDGNQANLIPYLINSVSRSESVIIHQIFL